MKNRKYIYTCPAPFSGSCILIRNRSVDYDCGK